MNLSENVKRFRKEAGLSQKALAELAGLSQQLISQIESGLNRSMTAENLAALAKALDRQVFDLEPDLASVMQGGASTIGQRILDLSEGRRNRMLETLKDLEAADEADQATRGKPDEPLG